MYDLLLNQDLWKDTLKLAGFIPFAWIRLPNLICRPFKTEKPTIFYNSRLNRASNSRDNFPRLCSPFFRPLRIPIHQLTTNIFEHVENWFGMSFQYPRVQGFSDVWFEIIITSSREKCFYLVFLACSRFQPIGTNNVDASHLTDDFIEFRSHGSPCCFPQKPFQLRIFKSFVHILFEMMETVCMRVVRENRKKIKDSDREKASWNWRKNLNQLESSSALTTPDARGNNWSVE